MPGVISTQGYTCGLWSLLHYLTVAAGQPQGQGLEQGQGLDQGLGLTNTYPSKPAATTTAITGSTDLTPGTGTGTSNASRNTTTSTTVITTVTVMSAMRALVDQVGDCDDLLFFLYPPPLPIPLAYAFLMQHTA